MTMSVTIPQMFYDLVARVIPGFLFLFLLHLELSGTGVTVIQSMAPQQESNSMALILSALVYGILSYLMGWILGAFMFGSTSDQVRENHESNLNLVENPITISEMVNRIRVSNETVGFRLVKLRAEAKMLETSRMGMVYALVISLGLLLLNELGYLPPLSLSPLEWGIRIGVPIVLVIAFRRCESRAWDNYFGRSIIHYEILFETKVRCSREENAPAPTTPNQASSG